MSKRLHYPMPIRKLFDRLQYESSAELLPPGEKPHDSTPSRQDDYRLGPTTNRQPPVD